MKHWDGFNPGHEKNRTQEIESDRGNRLVTALMYLNDVEEGGGTGFINMRFEVAASAGKLLIFHNCYAGTRATHSDSNHAGLPVKKGEKWGCNLWYREAPKDR